MTRVKLCGVTSAADRDAAVAAGADAVGFLVDVPVDSPREIAAETAATLLAGTPPFVTSVLVTMPEAARDAVALHERVPADVVQLHGGLSPDAVRTVARETGRPVVVAVDGPETAARYDDVADALLLDSAGERGRGGTGRTHDWSTARSVRDAVSSPLVLAGGLTPENVGAAVSAVDPFAVDVASGVERAPGEKDADAVAAFVDRATVRPDPTEVPG